MGLNTSKARLNEIHILVAEDEMVVRALLVDALRQVGFTVSETACAAEALKCAQESERLDLLFTDVRMPGAMNGLELAQQLRRERSDLQVIITTAHIDPPSVEGLGSLIAKPFLIDDAVDFACTLLGVE